MLPTTQFNNFVTANNLFTLQSKLLVAVSGGMDSVFLTHLLHKAGYNFAIAHCNFQLRGDEALQDEQFCRELAETFQVPFYETRFDTENYAAQNKLSIQMAARELRYDWFEQIRQQNYYDAIVLAHHQNDNVETILLNLARGTGIAGLHGIQPKNGYLVRPLLFMTREEIAESVKANKIKYREDSSNQSTKYARNKIRHQVIPTLKELNPNLEHTFAQEAKHFSELEQLLEKQLVKLREQIFMYHYQDVYLNILQVKQLAPLHLLLYGLLNPFGFSGSTVSDIVASLDKHAGRVFESGSHQLLIDRTHLIISPLKKEIVKTVSIFKGDLTADYRNYRISIAKIENAEVVNNRNIAMIDADKLQYPLTIRPWQQGNTFYPLGMKTKKKISDFFISLKIPLHKKAGVPLLINGNGDIIWVCGYRINDRYKITPATKKISIFELTEL